MHGCALRVSGYQKWIKMEVSVSPPMGGGTAAMRPRNAGAYTTGQNNLLHLQFSYLRLFQCAPGVSHSKIQPNPYWCGALIRYRLELQSPSENSHSPHLSTWSWWSHGISRLPKRHGNRSRKLLSTLRELAIRLKRLWSL